LGSAAARHPAITRRLLRRCLCKDPKRRLRHIGDARLELEESNQELPAVDRAPRRRAISAAIPWLAAAVATAIALRFAFRTAPVATEDSEFAGLRAERITYDSGLTTMPAISADGRLIAFASDRAGRGDLDIWVQLADGAPIRVTNGPEDELTPHFSPDGNQIVYRSEAEGGGVYVVPTLGGEPRLIAPEGRGPRFSPDGSRIAYWIGNFRAGSIAASATYLVPLGGGEPTRLLPDFETARDPVWSPDGRSLLIAAVPRRGGGIEPRWWRVPADASQPTRIESDDYAPVKAAVARTQRPDWTQRGLFFSDGQDLWLLPMSPDSGAAAGVARRLTIGAQGYEHPSVSRDGRIVFASTVTHRVIRRAPITSTGAPAPPVQLFEDTRGEGGRTSQTADGSQIVFERGLPNGREIWLRATASGSERLVAKVSERALLNATVSPDGSRVAYTAGRNGFVVETLRGVPKQICTDCAPHGFLSDNRRVLVIDPPPSGPTIRLIDVTTGAIHVIARTADGRLSRPHVSPDDRWLAFRREIKEGGKTFVAALSLERPATPETSMMVNEPTTTGRPCGWALDSRAVYLLLDTDGWRCLWGQRVDASGQLVGTPFPARHFHGVNDSGFGTTFGNAIGPGGLLYEGLRSTANVWMLRRAGE
jgi:Tol biopolymer transport system component